MTPIKWLAALLGVLGLLALVAAILFFTLPAHSLPSFLGPLPRVTAHRKRRGEAAIAIAVVLWVIAGIIFYVNNRSSDPAASHPAPSDPAPSDPAAS
jgi:uncharacterized membrane protein HdeD (DUF308 family)